MGSSVGWSVGWSVGGRGEVNCCFSPPCLIISLVFTHDMGKEDDERSCRYILIVPGSRRRRRWIHIKYQVVPCPPSR